MTDYLVYFAEIPECGIQCIFGELSGSTIPPQDLVTDICTNATLQTSLFQCMSHTCSASNYTEIHDLANIVCFTILAAPHVKADILPRIIMAVFAYPIIILRLVSPWLVTKTLWWDDYMMVLTLPLLLATTILGFLIDGWLSTSIVSSLRGVFVSEFLYLAAQVTIKVSILLFYIRVFPKSKIAKASWVLIAWKIVKGVVFVFLLIFRCNIVRASWSFVPNKTCIDLEDMIILDAACSIAEDIVIFALPIPTLLKLNVRPGQRVVLLLLFSCCSFACITSIVRLHYLRTTFGFDIEAAEHELDTLTWSMIENFSAAICACLPFLRPLFLALWKWSADIYYSYTSKTWTNIGPVEERQHEDRIELHTQIVVNDSRSHKSDKSTGSVWGIATAV